ncbi:hypothetical protein [Plantactinospora endophytica]|uniref:Uncharacterized protein n=1 Tax=Plantactinospora endophytica TaxID=673535 RepID=A0ABQ4E5J1_9ACTN|nr:hypothetical protein [Plantactinospora endophytica]GIG89960.1 hypothetical protein Pen02_48960 [Plantactinospora endophytica]
MTRNAATLRTATDPRLRITIVLTWVLVLEHLYALVTPPYQLGVEHAFHLSFGIAYAWLALRLPAGRPWHRNLLTILLAVQFVGRFFVFAAIPDTWIRISLIPGALVTLVLVTLLWVARRPPVPASTGSR